MVVIEVYASPRDAFAGNANLVSAMAVGGTFGVSDVFVAIGRTCLLLGDGISTRLVVVIHACMGYI